MKSIKFILILFIFFAVSSCEDVFDKQPLNKISDSDVWQQKSLIESYVTDLYSRWPWDAFSHYQWYNFSDEGTFALGSSYNNVATGGATRTNDNISYWSYDYLRDINVFLEKIGDTPLNEADRNQLEGEVRVIRAWVYFEMQMRYGGVPLVDVVLDPFGEIDEEYTKRETEEAIVDFIDSELNAAISLLPDDSGSRGRINKWTAYGLKARANLWSASIAKYGVVQLNGLVGIPASRADEFYDKASNAAETVISSGKYSLYNELADKSENYRNLFLDESNNEVIFEKIYDGVNIGHSFDLYCAPPSIADGRGGCANPTLEFILGYENIDGSMEQPEFGSEHLYNSGYEPFENKDPRLYATVFFQGDQWADGTIIQTYEGIDPSVEPDPNAIISNPNESYNGVSSVGNDSRKTANDDNSTNSGFIAKKYITNDSKVGGGRSTTNWIYLRLAEMYLIKAEAEFELGHAAAAATALNFTRERAGISLVDANSITLEKVRTERRSELAFEKPFRYWDLRRLRIAEEVLTSHRFQGLRIILHYETGKYYYLPFECEDFSRVFRAEHYYQPITDGRIDNNPDLVENPLY